MTPTIEPVESVGRRASGLAAISIHPGYPGVGQRRSAPSAPAASAGPADERAPRSAPPPTPAQPRPMRIEVSLNAGVQTVTIIDVSSGQPIYQAPPEHTRQALERARRQRPLVGRAPRQSA